MPMALVKAGYFFFQYRKMLTTLRIISAWSLGGGGSARSEMVLGHMMVGFLALFLIIFLCIHSVMLLFCLWLEFSILIAFREVENRTGR